jgi:predicted SAM-dependent methyltransferase
MVRVQPTADSRLSAKMKMEQSLSSGLKLNLGCGPVQPAGWVNIDGSNRAFLAAKLNVLDRLLTRAGLISPTEFGPHTKYLNILHGLPYPDNSISCIYSGELWEHFEYPDAEKTTAECYRVLQPGGVLRLCVPDGPAFWQKYLDTYDQVRSLPRDSRTAQPLRAIVQLYFNEICTKRVWFGSMGHKHKWQWDEVQLIELLEQKGFKQVERRALHNSRIPEVAAVEVSNFLIVEAIK